MFRDHEVRAVWNEPQSKWMFSVLDIVGAINGERDYEKNRNYWKFLNAKFKKEGFEVGSDTTHFNSQSKLKAYALFDSSLINTVEAGTVKGLQQIHAYIFGGLYPFAGQIRTVNIAKGGFQFAMARYLSQTLTYVEKLPQSDFAQIIDKYVEMNVAHPFREGNGRASRIWLDIMLRNALGKCVDWSKIDKRAYLEAMTKSVADASEIKRLIAQALTDRIADREIFMKGIDYSYYYEEEDTEITP